MSKCWFYYSKLQRERVNDVRKNSIKVEITQAVYISKSGTVLSNLHSSDTTIPCENLVSLVLLTLPLCNPCADNNLRATETEIYGNSVILLIT